MRMSGVKPRVHGNGFLQYDFDNINRLHIWHPNLPRQKVSTPIHDHAFNFKSRCFVGRLINVCYDFIEVPAHDPTADLQVYTATVRQGEDTVLGPANIYGHVVPSYTEMMMAKTCFDRYVMPSNSFHESIAPDGVAATMICKLTQEASVPRVLVPRGLEPDNDFNRYTAAPEELLWDVIQEVVGSKELHLL